jgi:outer membrane lipoprotein-sorting protein
MIVRKPYLCVLIGLVASSAVYGATASDVVRKAQAANAHVSYRGTKIARVVAGGRAVSSQMQITHLKPDMTRTQYYSPKMLAGVIVVQRGANVWKYVPRQRAWERLHSAASGPPDGDLDVALSNYSVRLIGSEKAVGRDAYIVLATPKRAGESVLRLWIDKQSYLTLRTQVEKPSGGVTSSSSFSSITVNPSGILPLAFAVTTKEKAAPKVGALDFRVAKPKYLPKGYKPVGQTRGKVSGHLCVHLQFSNGVNTISLFERRSKGDAKAPKVPGRLTSVLTWTRHEMLFTLIGDLPRNELQKIADSTI